MKNKEIERITPNYTLLNILSPIGGIEYKKDHFRVGDYYGRVYAITKYPQQVRTGWLESIANVPNNSTRVKPFFFIKSPILKYYII